MLNFILRLLKCHPIIGLASTFLAALSQAWLSKDTIKILGYRPTDETLLWVTLVGGLGMILAYIFQLLLDKYTSTKLEQSCRNSITFFQDQLFAERSNDLGECLQRLYEKLSFTMGERISVYRFIEAEKQFECISRKSAHPTYEGYGVRSRYPADSGIIGHVWEKHEHNGFKLDNQIPCYTKNAKAYLEYLKSHYGIAKEVAKNFRMKSICMAACLVRDGRNKPLAVIVFESKERNKIDERSLLSVYDKSESVILANKIIKLKEQPSPDMKKAKELGL